MNRLSRVASGIMLSAAFAAPAATRYVNATLGNDSADGLTAATAVRTLQKAVDAAGRGDTIIVADGVYAPIVDTRSIAYTILGENGRDKVFIDGGGKQRCCTFLRELTNSVYGGISSQPVTVKGITLCNGATQAKGLSGNIAYGGGALGGTFRDCRILYCRAEGSGGAVCDSFLYDCEIRGCQAAGPYGAVASGGSISDSLVVENLSTGGSVSAWSGPRKESLLFNGTKVARSTVANNHTTIGTLDVFRYGWFGYFTSFGASMVTNNIVYGNCRLYGDTFRFSTPSRLNGTLWDVDPAFRDMSAGVYTLTARSPRLDAGCFPGVDAKPYVSASVRGPGGVLSRVAYIDDGKAELLALDFNRRFTHWADASGRVVSTDLRLSLSNPASGSAYTAVFTNSTLEVVGTDPANLQRAIDSACDGDTIQAGPGVYSPIRESTKELTIVGAGIGQSVIDGGGTERCATFHSYTNRVTLRGFTLRHGLSYDGAGVLFGRIIACEMTDGEVRAGGNGSDTNYGGGGAAYARLESCVVTRNKSNGDGAGVMGGAIYNCTVAGNQSLYRGSNGYCGLAPNVVAYNSVIHRNFWYDGEVAEPINWAGGSEHNYNSNADCGLIDPEHGDCRPRKGASILRKGSFAHPLPPVDVTGAARVTSGTVSYGAYETAQFDGWVVKSRIVGHGSLVSPTQTCADGGSVTFEAVETGRPFLCFETNGVVAGTSKVLVLEGIRRDFTVTAVFEQKTHVVGGEGEYADIQSAVNAAYAGETVLVRPGVYAPFDTLEKRLNVVSSGGRDVTIVDGGGTNRCATLGSSARDGSTLAGFTLRRGLAANCGGGAYYGALTDCTVRECCASNDTQTAYGGGTYCTTLDRCLIVSNCVYSGRSDGAGGGFYYGNTTNTQVIGNAVIAYGVKNGQTRGGGGCGHSMTHHVNMLFVGNRIVTGINGGLSDAYGGAMANGHCVNCTFVGNRAECRGVGLASKGGYENLWSFSNGSNRNALSYGNSGETSPNPLFVDPEGGDYRLLEGSSAVDAGANYAELAGVTDLAGNPRLAGSRVDLGCYEGAVAIDRLPGAIGRFTATQDAEIGVVRLDWSSAAYATEYRVYRSSIAGGVDARLIATTTALSYADAAVTDGEVWYYRVEPVNRLGAGETTALAAGRAARPLVITTAALPRAVVNREYACQLSAAGGGGDYTWSLDVDAPYSAESADPLPLEDLEPTYRGSFYPSSASWNVALPFPFRFYGTTHTNVFLNVDGSLTFGADCHDYSSSESSLYRYTMIEALQAYPLVSNICTRATADSYTVRWLGYHYNFSSGPYDVAVTLYRNGNILFQFGKNSTTYGCSGISDGLGTYQTVSCAAGTAVLMNCNTGRHLPFGLELSPDGRLSGVSEALGEKTLKLRVTDQHGNAATKVFGFATSETFVPEVTDETDGDGNVTGRTVTTEVTVATNGATSAEVTIGTESNCFVASDDAKPVTVSAGVGTITFNTEAVRRLGESVTNRQEMSVSASVRIRVEDTTASANPEAASSALNSQAEMVFNVSATIGDDGTVNFGVGDANAEVVLTDIEDRNPVVYRAEGRTRVRVPAVYDREKGTLTFTMSALNTAYSVEYTDVLIETREDWNAFAASVADGTSYVNKLVALVAPLDFTGRAFAPVGTAEHPFDGLFQGNGLTLRGASVAAETGAAGVFAYTQDAVIHGLTLADATVSAPTAGALVGEARGYLWLKGDVAYGSCTVTGTTSAGGFAGALAATGAKAAEIDDGYCGAVVTAPAAGGFVGALASEGAALRRLLREGSRNLVGSATAASFTLARSVAIADGGLAVYNASDTLTPAYAATGTEYRNAAGGAVTAQAVASAVGAGAVATKKLLAFTRAGETRNYPGHVTLTLEEFVEEVRANGGIFNGEDYQGYDNYVDGKLVITWTVAPEAVTNGVAKLDLFDGLGKVVVRNVGFAYDGETGTSGELVFNNTGDVTIGDCDFDRTAVVITGGEKSDRTAVVNVSGSGFRNVPGWAIRCSEAKSLYVQVNVFSNIGGAIFADEVSDVIQATGNHFETTVGRGNGESVMKVKAAVSAALVVWGDNRLAENDNAALRVAAPAGSAAGDYVEVMQGSRSLGYHPVEGTGSSRYVNVSASGSGSIRTSLCLARLADADGSFVNAYGDLASAVAAATNGQRIVQQASGDEAVTLPDVSADSDIAVVLAEGVVNRLITASESSVVERVRNADGSVTCQAVPVTDAVTLSGLPDARNGRRSLTFTTAWMLEHGVSPRILADTTRTEANGLAVWESYVLGLEPTNAASTVKVDFAMGDRGPELKVAGIDLTDSPVTVRYVLYATDDLAKPFAVIGTAQDSAEFEDLEASGAGRFYKVGVELIWK